MSYDFVFMDEKTFKKFGPANLRKFSTVCTKICLASILVTCYLGATVAFDHCTQGWVHTVEFREELQADSVLDFVSKSNFILHRIYLNGKSWV